MQLFRPPTVPAFFLRQLFLTPTPPPSTTDLSGELAIVTGSNTGLGLEVARQLLSLHLSTLILAVRSTSKGEAAASTLSSSFPEANIQVWELDMNSYDSIRAFAHRASMLPRLDYAILNAGVAKTTFSLNKSTGHEETIQVNYLSTAALTLLLVPIIRAKKSSPSAKTGKISIIGSETGYWSPFQQRKQNPILTSFDNPTSFESSERYQVSKLLLDFFVSHAASVIPKEDVVLNISNPGLCVGSEIHRDVAGITSYIIEFVKSLIGRSLEVGARALVKAAVVAGEEGHGAYYDANGIDVYPDLLVGPEGPAISERLWKELQAELKFIDFATLSSK